MDFHIELVIKHLNIHVSHFQIRDDAAFIYVDASDENKSNWMRCSSY